MQNVSHASDVFLLIREFIRRVDTERRGGRRRYEALCAATRQGNRSAITLPTYATGAFAACVISAMASLATLHQDGLCEVHGGPALGCRVPTRSPSAFLVAEKRAPVGPPLTANIFFLFGRRGAWVRATLGERRVSGGQGCYCPTRGRTGPSLYRA